MFNLIARNVSDDGLALIDAYYRKTSSISHTKFQNLNVSCILVQLSSLNPLKPGTSELSTISLATKVRLILEVLRYDICKHCYD